jgi:tetratricopeptide (TPR) repeat protein
MIVSLFQRTVIVFLAVWVSGCASMGGGTVPQDSLPEIQKSEPPVNSYYLYSQSHLNAIRKDMDGAISSMQMALALDPTSSFLKKELAGLWLVKKENLKALELLGEVLTEQPEDVEALILSGRIHQSMGQAMPAIANYEKALFLDPLNENLHLQLGRLYMDQQQWDKAGTVYNNLVLHFPSSYAGYFFLGRISTINGDKKAAKKYFEKTLALEPELVEPRFELGMIYEAEGDFEKAVRTYKEVLKENPTNVRARMAMGLNYHKQGLRKEAEKVFFALGQTSISDPLIARALVSDYIDIRNFEDADIIVKGMLAGAPDNTDLVYISGITLDGLGEKEAAIKQLIKVVPDSRFYENAAIHAALLYQELGRNQEAVASLLKAVERDPENAEFRYYLGSFYEQAEDYENAEKELKEGLDSNPNHPRLHFRLGVIYDKLGQKEACIEEMKMVLELDPDNANALNYLGYTYADLGHQLEEAERLIKKALAIKPGDGYIIDSLAWVYYQRKEYEKALPLLQKAASLVPEDPIVKEHLGDVYRKLGMTEEAIQSYRQAIENGHEEKETVLEKIRSISP